MKIRAMLRSRERWLHDNHFFFGEFKCRVVLLWDVSFVDLIHQIVIVMVGHEQLHFFVFYEIMEIELWASLVSLSAIKRHLFDASKRE